MMTKKKKDTTTLIFVNNEQNLSKSVKIPSAYVRHWKKIIMGVALSILFLLALLMYTVQVNMGVKASNQQMAHRLGKTNNLNGQNSEIDTASLKKYYESVDKQLLVINKYLKARGLKPLKKYQGGESGNEMTSVKETSSFYKSYLNKMINLVWFTPMGYPYFGDITSGFGYRENPFTGEAIERHKGLDIRGNYGGPVKSTAGGQVTFASRKGDYGNCVIINHGNGFETYYGHLSKILVNVGQDVSVGQLIGKIGSTGRSTGPHLHYEIRKNGIPINPRSYLTVE